MYISLYDKNFNSISENSTLVVSKFKLVRRAYDLNEFTADCSSIDITAYPMFAVLRENTGDRYYDILAPLITRDNYGVSKVIGRDLYSVFNTECVIDFSQKQSTVYNLINFIFTSWKNYDISGFNTTLKTDNILNLIVQDIFQPSQKNVYNVMELFNKITKTYKLYFTSKINVRNKTLEFEVLMQTQFIRKIKLEDFNIQNFGKYDPKINTVVSTTSDFSVRHNWFLLKNGEITTQSNLRDIFPTASKIFVADDINATDFEAVSELAENRFQEEIEINIIYDYDRLSLIDFNTSFDVFYNNEFYKTLPIGEIIDDGTKNRIIKLGFLPTEFIQLI